MARAALRLSSRQVGEILGVSHGAICRYERSDEDVISLRTVMKAKEFFESKGIFFGPKDGVCVGQDAFTGDRWFTTACLQLLKEAGITPSSTELLAAHRRAIEES